MLMWVMSDRAIPRSYRTMQGFGVHSIEWSMRRASRCSSSFTGTRRPARTRWCGMKRSRSRARIRLPSPRSVGIDRGRRLPEYELGVQIITEEQAEKFSFDVLDATKLVPEELVPVRPIGRMVLNRNPDNFFAETEQVAFCTAQSFRVSTSRTTRCWRAAFIPYVDTQISRLGGRTSTRFRSTPRSAGA